MKTCVLVAESDVAVRTSYQKALEAAGYRVMTAANGLECMLKLSREPAVLVLDCNLLWGGANGVISEIRESWDVPTIPIILITNHNDAEEPTDQVIDPVVAYVHKPFHIDTLLQCLDAANELLSEEVGQ